MLGFWNIIPMVVEQLESSVFQPRLHYKVLTMLLMQRKVLSGMQSTVLKSTVRIMPILAVTSNLTESTLSITVMATVVQHIHPMELIITTFCLILELIVVWMRLLLTERLSEWHEMDLHSTGQANTGPSRKIKSTMIQADAPTVS